MILFVGVPSRPPYLVSASGGESTQVPSAEGADFRWFPSFLPDGRHYLYLGLAGTSVSYSIRAASLDSPDTVELVRSQSPGLYVAPGYLLFLRDGVLVAQPFDATTRRLSGSAVTIVEDVGYNAITYRALFSASQTGALVYMGAQPGSQIVWFDRQGQRLAAVTAPGNYNSLCLTEGDRRIVYELADPASANVDLWALDVGSETPVRLTFNPAVDFYAVCSPDGKEIAYASLREGPPNIFRMAIASPGSDKAVLRSLFAKIPSDWSRDGRLLVYSVLSPKTNWDIHVVPIDGGEPMEFAATVAEERNARLSPDGRWMAYISNESGGRHEVFVRPFPSNGAKWQVSRGGGLQPQWRRDGAELYYLASDRWLVAVRVKAGAAGVTFGTAQRLFDTRANGWESTIQDSQYAATADGTRFAASTATDTVRSITLVLDWTAAQSR